MNDILEFLERHNYWLLFAAVLGRQACLPIPANLILVAAGALARSGKFNLSAILGLSVVTFLFADLAWYEAGRRFGERILHCVCSLTRDHEGCIHRATGSFSKYGVRTLLLSKFVFGFDAVAAPLAGDSRTPRTVFLLFDGLGAAFWTASYVALGYIFSNQLDLVATHLARIGWLLAIVASVAFCFYVARRLLRWLRFLRQFNLARISPEELKDKLDAGEDILLIDLQGRRHTLRGAMAIPGAVRINPHTLEQYKGVKIPPAREIVLYCCCPGELTSARVALALRQRGIEHVRPLAGGLKAWRERGFPVTAEVATPGTPPIHA